MAELARAMNTSWAAASRLGDPSHWPTLKLLDKAVRATGKRLVISVEQARKQWRHHPYCLLKHRHRRMRY